MRKQRIGYIGLVCVVIAFALLTLSSGKPEPEYQGRPLHQWVLLLDSTNSPAATEAATALQQMGTNAIPFLLRWVAYTPHPSQAGQVLANALAGIPAIKHIGPVQRWIYLDTEQFGLAEMTPAAFQVLGPRALGAAPALARLLGPTQDPALAPRVVRALENIGPATMPTLIQVLTNGNADARFWTATAMTFMGTNARPAVPALIQCLSDPAAARPAFHALGALKLEPQVVVPALTNRSQDPDPAIRLSVIFTLGGFGREARAAIPTLQNALQDVDLRVRDEAANLLCAIAPEALTNAPTQ